VPAVSSQPTRALRSARDHSIVSLDRGEGEPNKRRHACETFVRSQADRFVSAMPGRRGITPCMLRQHVRQGQGKSEPMPEWCRRYRKAYANGRSTSVERGNRRVGRLPIRTVSHAENFPARSCACSCIFARGRTAGIIGRRCCQLPNAALCISACKIHYAIENTDLSPCVWSSHRGSAMLDERNCV
jgi:hypothetical protein